MNRDVKKNGVAMGLYRVVSNQSVGTYIDDGLDVGHVAWDKRSGSFQGFEGIRVTLNPGKRPLINVFSTISIPSLSTTENYV
jgi:hypothetical protein